MKKVGGKVKNHLPDCRTDRASEFPGNASGKLMTEIK